MKHESALTCISFAGHVVAHKERALTAFVGKGLAGFGIDVADGDKGALLQQQLYRRAANAAGTTGDQRHFVLNSSHVNFPCLRIGQRRCLHAARKTRSRPATVH